MENGDPRAPIVVWLQRVPDGARTAVTVDPDSLVSELGLELVGRGVATGASIRYVHRGRVLQPTQRLDTYDIRAEDTVFYSIATSPTHSGSGGSGQFGSGEVRGQSPPGTLADEMMVSPLMDSVVRNPDLLMMIMDANPTIRALRQRSPEINAILNDPQTLQDAFTAMRSPAMMREMMRTSDRALSNIDAVPGGFDALRQVYTEVQEPVWETVSSAMEAENPRRESGGEASSYDLNESGDEPFPQAWPGEQPPIPAPEEETPSFLRPINLFGTPMMGGFSSPAGPDLPPFAAAAAAPSRTFWPSLVPSLSRPSAAAVPQAERYRPQLEALRSMGFEDAEACERALIRNDGNLNRAIDELLREHPPPS